MSVTNNQVDALLDIINRYADASRLVTTKFRDRPAAYKERMINFLYTVPHEDYLDPYEVKELIDNDLDLLYLSADNETKLIIKTWFKSPISGMTIKEFLSKSGV